MMSTDGLELTGVINTRLPWKAVAKGSRSTMRRTRKPATQSAMPELEAEDKTAGEVSTAAREVEAEGVSDSEKHGVAVLGQHFAERVENVPIKKRRFIVRSTSPLNRSSPRHEGSEHRAQINDAVYVSRLNPSLDDGRSSEGTLYDFSGIQILADVACSSDIINDFAPARENFSTEEPKQQQNLSTSSSPLEGDGLLARTTAISQKDTLQMSSDKVGQGEVDTAVSQEHPVIEDSSSVGKHIGVASEKIAQNNSISSAVSEKLSVEEPKENTATGEADSLALQNNTSTVSTKSAANEQEKIPCPKDDRLHWDLNLSMDDWAQPCDVENDPSQRDAKGEVAESTAHAESEHIDNVNDHVDGAFTSEVLGNMSMPLALNPKTDAQNSKDFQSGYDSQYEDGELRESYPCWDENEGDVGEIEEVDYGSEPEEERCYSLDRSDEIKMEDADNGMMSETQNRPRKSESADGLRMTESNEGGDIEKHVVAWTNDPHVKGSSPSRGFIPKPFKELPSHGVIHRRRSVDFSDSYDRDFNSAKFVGRDRSGMHIRGRSPWKGHFGGWDSKRQPSPFHRDGSYNFSRPRPKSIIEGRGLMNGFDQAAGSGPDGHVRRQFSNGAYRGRFRRYHPDGMNHHDFRGVDRTYPGDGNEYHPSRMHHQTGGRRDRSNSPVFRRLHYPQAYRKSSRSRSRSRSPLSWSNSRTRSPGFRPDDRMERVRLPFQKRFPADQEMGFMSPPRNRMSPQRNTRWFEGRNHDGGESNSVRGRRSPGRMFRTPGQGQRFDNGYSMRRVNSDSHLRPVMRHRRFVDGAGLNKEGGGGGNRGCKYEGREEVKGGNRYEMVHRAQRVDANGIASDG